MSKRWLVAIPGLAALICAGVMAYLIIQIDQTRRELQADGVLEFNFIQQVDHNYDTLAQSLTDYLTANQSGRATSNELREEYIKRYDVLYSAIRNIRGRWMGYLEGLESTQQLMTDSNAFLDRYEPLMSAKVVAKPADLFSMNQEARELSRRVYDIGLEMFSYKSTVRDNVSRRIDTLYEALWIFGFSFLTASLMTIGLMFALTRRAETLTADAEQTQTQLTTALDELTSGDLERRAQNRFMAAASHDLRQPLHALGLYLSALERHISSDQGLSILANINRSTEALNQLLNSMLDLSKLDAGVVDVNYEPVSLDTTFENLYRTFLPEANQRNLLLDVQHSGLSVYTDRVLLERILGNLVGNALNYTARGHVKITARQVDSKASIRISDTGPGIPPQEQEAIFNEYYQLQNPERDRTKGLGLGLSIVRRLTRLLNIELLIQSIVNAGTCFELQIRLSDENESTPELVQGNDISGANLSGLSILVIDDEHDVRDGMRTLLKQYDCDVVMADSSEQAQAHIAAHEWVPDLIIADYRLRDDKTGDSAIDAVREEVNMDVPAMIITGDTSPARLRDATASGFPLLHKPVIADELISAIVKITGE